MKRLTTIELHKEQLTFAAGHFTIFSKTERENLHGHNYQVYVAITTCVDDNGLQFDYRFYKQKILALCQMLKQHVLLPERSPYLTINDEGDRWVCDFHDEHIPFLKRDALPIDVANISVEELSNYFLKHLLEDIETLKSHNIENLLVKVYSSPGQSGSAIWELTK